MASEGEGKGRVQALQSGPRGGSKQMRRTVGSQVLLFSCDRLVLGLERYSQYRYTIDTEINWYISISYRIVPALVGLFYQTIELVLVCNDKITWRLKYNWGVKFYFIIQKYLYIKNCKVNVWVFLSTTCSSLTMPYWKKVFMWLIAMFVFSSVSLCSCWWTLSTPRHPTTSGVSNPTTPRPHLSKLSLSFLTTLLYVSNLTTPRPHLSELSLSFLTTLLYVSNPTTPRLHLSKLSLSFLTTLLHVSNPTTPRLHLSELSLHA